MSAKVQRQISDEALAAIASTAVRQPDGSFRVLSSDGSRSYVVTPYSCSCPDWINRKSYTGEKCRHQLSIELICPPPKPYTADAFAGFD